jgi:hypothetical protein
MWGFFIVRILMMWRIVMHGMVHRAMMRVVMNNPAVVYRMMILRVGKTGQSEEQSDSE